MLTMIPVLGNNYSHFAECQTGGKTVTGSGVSPASVFHGSEKVLVEEWLDKRSCRANPFMRATGFSCIYAVTNMTGILKRFPDRRCGRDTIDLSGKPDVHEHEIRPGIIPEVIERLFACRDRLGQVITRFCQQFQCAECF